MYAIKRGNVVGTLRWNSVQDAWSYIRWTGMQHAQVVRATMTSVNCETCVVESEAV